MARIVRILRVVIVALLFAVAVTTALAVDKGTKEEEPLEVQYQQQDRGCSERIFQDGPPGTAPKLPNNIEIRDGEPDTFAACTTINQTIWLGFSKPIPHNMSVTESNPTLKIKYLLKADRKCMYWAMESMLTPFEMVSCSKDAKDDCSCRLQIHIDKEGVSEEASRHSADGLDGDMTTAVAASAPVAASETSTNFTIPEVPEAKMHSHTSVELSKTTPADGQLATDGDVAISHTITEPANRWNDQQHPWLILTLVVVVLLCVIIWLALYLHLQRPNGQTPTANPEANFPLLHPPV